MTCIDCIRCAIALNYNGSAWFPTLLASVLLCLFGSLLIVSGFFFHLQKIEPVSTSNKYEYQMTFSDFKLVDTTRGLCAVERSNFVNEAKYK